jgi:hypothetical protein
LKAKVNAKRCDPPPLIAKPKSNRGRPTKYESEEARHAAKVLQNRTSRQRVLERKNGCFDETLMRAINDGTSREALEKLHGKRVLNAALKRLNLTL